MQYLNVESSGQIVFLYQTPSTASGGIGLNIWSIYPQTESGFGINQGIINQGMKGGGGNFYFLHDKTR